MFAVGGEGGFNEEPSIVSDKKGDKFKLDKYYKEGLIYVGTTPPTHTSASSPAWEEGSDVVAGYAALLREGGSPGDPLAPWSPLS